MNHERPCTSLNQNQKEARRIDIEAHPFRARRAQHRRAAAYTSAKTQPKQSGLRNRGAGGSRKEASRARTPATYLGEVDVKEEGLLGVGHLDAVAAAAAAAAPLLPLPAGGAT